MEGTLQETLIQRAKVIAEAKMRQHEREREELDSIAYQMSAHSNRKERRATESEQRKRK